MDVENHARGGVTGPSHNMVKCTGLSNRSAGAASLHWTEGLCTMAPTSVEPLGCPACVLSL